MPSVVRPEREGCETIKRLMNNREAEVEKTKEALLLGVDSVQCYTRQRRNDKQREMLARSTGTGQRRGSNKY